VLVRRYKDVLYRYAERMTGRVDEAEDLVQRSLIKGFNNLSRCREPERFGGWLYRIVVNLCKDQLKGRHRLEVPLESVAERSSKRAGPDRDFDRSALREELYQALQELSPDRREAFVLKHVEGWSYEEMAEVLQVSVSALKMRVMRAREHMQELLEHYR